VAIVAAASLVLTGCGSGDTPGDLADVSVSKAANPKVAVDKGFTATKTTSRVLSPGSGAQLASGDSVKVNYVAINGRTGKEFDNSFTSDKPVTLPLDDKSVLAGFVKGLIGQKVGSRVLVAIPPKDGFGRAEPDLGMKKDDTMVFLFDVVATVPSSISGTAQALPKTVPSLKVDAKNNPSGFVKTKDTPAKVTKSTSNVVIEGKGPVVTADQTITAHYFGQIYPGGTTFDDSFSRGEPLNGPLARFFKCWQDEIPGNKVGSRIVLVCPSDVAAGDEPQREGSPIKPGDTLIFSIDLLDAS